MSKEKVENRLKYNIKLCPPPKGRTYMESV
jgi:hypothetical protein